jgi:hypothetical protein
MIIKPKGNGKYDVQSRTDPKKSYEVDIYRLTCECPSNRYKKKICPHIREVCARITDGTIDNVDKSNAITEGEAEHNGRI